MVISMAGIGFKGKVIAIAVVCILVGMGFGYLVTVKTVKPSNSETNYTTEDPVILDTSPSQPCAWDSEPNHGAPATDHTLLAACGKLTGRVVLIEMYVEGENDLYHFLLRPDTQFTSMLNDNNNVKLGGALMIEINKENQGILPRLHVGQHLEVQGPHVLDLGPLYNEIHPVKVIKEI
jgi:hypothetical protein